MGIIIQILITMAFSAFFSGMEIALFHPINYVLKWIVTAKA